MKRILVLLAAAPIVLVATGCASIVNGPNQKILVETNPPGAVASALGKSVVTPGSLVIPRKTKEARIRIEKGGYQTQLVPLLRKDSAALWLNMIALPAGFYAGGAIGVEQDSGWSFQNAIAGSAIGGFAAPMALMGTDMATGAAYKLVPSHVIVDLKPIAEPAAALRP